MIIEVTKALRELKKTNPNVLRIKYLYLDSVKGLVVRIDEKTVTIRAKTPDDAIDEILVALEGGRKDKDVLPMEAKKKISKKKKKDA